MSSLDSYRRNVIRKRDEIARLQQEKAKEQTKIANLSAKINSASQALSRTNSESTARSKLREIERHQKDQATAEKKVADFDSKIARKHKELSDEQKKVSREEEQESRKRLKESERQARAHASRMSQINNTLEKHEGIHQKTIATLKRLQDLPEQIVVLFLASNPVGEQQLRLDEEARSITDMIRKSKHRDSVVFESRWAVQPMDVLQAINELNPTIVHFSGHGSDTDQIVFQDTNGNAKLVSKEAIVQTMMASSIDIRLVFFNTCYSHNQAEAVTQHVEAAIGMNTSIGDEAAKVFSSQFYSSIGFGFSIKKSFDQAKALVMMEGLNEEKTPELFVQEGLDANDLFIVRPEGATEKLNESAKNYSCALAFTENTINRYLDDFEFQTERLRKDFLKDHKNLREQLGVARKIDGGEEVVKTCELGVKYQEKIFILKKELLRSIEDILFDRFKIKDIADMQELKTLNERLNLLLNQYERYMEVFKEPAASLSARGIREDKIFKEYFGHEDL